MSSAVPEAHRGPEQSAQEPSGLARAAADSPEDGPDNEQGLNSDAEPDDSADTAPGSGPWLTWAHRGAGMLLYLFLVVHVISLARLRVSANSFDRLMDIYRNPAVIGVGIVLLVAVVFHALNGLRIIISQVAADGPRPGRPRPERASSEFHLWLLQRVLGVITLVLAGGHVLVMTVFSGGLARVNFAFVAGRWATAFWPLWDLLLLWAALLHSTLGLRAVVNDNVRRDGLALSLKGLLYAVTTVVIALGTLVIFTFDPSV